MTIDFSELLSLDMSEIKFVSLIVFRVGAAMAFLPVFGEQVVPPRIKLFATLSLTALLAPMIWPQIDTLPANKHWFALIASEVIVGLLIGLAFRLLVFALQIAGTIAAQSTSLSQFFGSGLGVDPQPAFSTLLVISGLCLAIMLGLHIRVVELLLYSYERFPLGANLESSVLTGWVVENVGYAFGLAFSLAGPFVFASLVYNLGLGAINKAMPQLMVALVGAPAISLGGLTLLLIASPILLSVWGRAFVRLTSPEGIGL
ncbi:flagellar biosynthetic protein FliR [Litoreibacter arenae]|uniref:flagellar biosynthetic protein FliR n=1 Tax=Litoreibacter arenae TaxID=491388 RepID=UPI001FE16C96|nr:flagellar biosynthetic protein FliR [Litoreibacter arenae]